MKIGVMFGNRAGPETTTTAATPGSEIRKIMFPEPEAASAKDGGDGAVEAAAEGADAASEVAEKPAPARKGKSKSRGGDDDEDTGSGTDDELF
jgi:hypothetical protein